MVDTERQPVGWGGRRWWALLAALLLAAVVPPPSASPAASPPTTPVPVSGSDAFLGVARQAKALLGAGADYQATRRGIPPSVTGGEGTDVQQTFWAWDYVSERYYQVHATRVHASPRSQIYVEEGHRVPGAAIRQLAVLFEDVVYPRLRNRYGPDPNPGVDGLPAITLLLLDIRDPLYYGLPPYTYISGYFDPTNEYAQGDLDRGLPGRRSNEREMLYLDISPTDARGTIIKQTAAHEFAHLIVWNHDAEEEGWLVEGLGELAVYLCGLGHPREHLEAYLKAPELPLVTWSGEVRDYGKVYAFMLYLHEQVGEADSSWLRELVASPQRGMDSLAEVLPLGRSIPQLFRDYALALYLDEPEASGGRYGFRALDLDREISAGGFPAALAHVWSQYPQEIPVVVKRWTVRADRFALGQGALQIELVPRRPTCVGAGWMSGYRLHRAAVQFAASCPRAGQPVSWLFPSFGVGLEVETIHTVIANASDVPLDITVSALPPAGIESHPLPLLLPAVLSR